MAKNFLLSSEQSITRKIKEALLARRIEQAFTKNHILELYLNEIYLGQGSYGIASAALNYFDKDLADLTIDEMAYLAALPKAPNNYHPTRKTAAAIERRNWVLERMVKNNFITHAEAATASMQDLAVVGHTPNALKTAGYYAEEVRRFIVNKYGDKVMYNGGLFVRTSMDPILQETAVLALQNGLLEYDKRHGWRGAIENITFENDWQSDFNKRTTPAHVPTNWRYGVVENISDKVAHIYIAGGDTGQILLTTLSWAKTPLEDGAVDNTPIKKISDVLSIGDVIFVSPKESNTTNENIYYLQQEPTVEGALVAMNPHTGRVVAMVGGFSYYKNQFNRSIQAHRQPGSAFKPFVYLAGLDSGYNPSSLILDAPVVMKQPDGSIWKPRNYSKRFYGPTTMRVGLEQSRNLMTIRLAQAVGVKKVASYATKFDISDNFLPVLSSALGSNETTLMRLTTAYASLVNGGKQITPNLIDRIQDRNGTTVYKHDTRPCPHCVGTLASAQEKPLLFDTRAQIQDPVSAYQMVNMLKGVVERGTGRIANSLGYTIAGKSGTSNDSQDAWFIGFSPDLVAGVWVGFDTPKTLGPRDTGGTVAGPIFKDFMQEALKYQDNIPFRIPAGVRLMRVNPYTGKPSTAKSSIQEAFNEKDTNLFSTAVIGGYETITKQDSTNPNMGSVY